MKRKHAMYIILITVGVVIALLFAINYSPSLKRIYLITFHRDGIIGHYNGNDRLDGEVYFYMNGKVTRKADFKNGLLDRWAIDYYPNGLMKTRYYYHNNQKDSVGISYYSNGNIKRKETYKDGKYDGLKLEYYQNGRIENRQFFKNNKTIGIEYEYYKDGNLNYTRNWVNNHPYGDIYFYDDNEKKKVLFYHAYDILGIKFYLNRYDESRTEGYAFSSHIYTKDQDSVIVLKNNKSYKSISDLYVTIANPESNSTQIQIFINHKRNRKFDLIDKNTIKVSNVFLKKGTYDIVINGRFVDKPDDITTLKIKVTKE